MLITAGVIDYSRTFVLKRHLRGAVDAAALALVTIPNLTDEELTAKAEAYIRANYPDGAPGELINFSAKRENDDIVVSATARIDTAFLSVAGIDTLDVTVNGTAVRQDGFLEVVLVLDNTGSMSGAKLTALKSAAKTLVDILYADQQVSQNVKIGLVPFATAVNLGSPPESWLDMQGLSSIHRENVDLNGQTLFDLFDKLAAKRSEWAWAGCVRARTEPYDTQDTPPDPSNPETLWTPYFAPDEPDLVPSLLFLVNYVNDYIVDWKLLALSPKKRQRSVTKYDHIIPQILDLPLFPLFGEEGPNYLCHSTPVTPLTSNKSIIINAIDSMKAAGNTVIPAGLAWGWRVISSDEPYTEGQPYSDQNTKKVIILLTDGQNWVTQGENGHNNSYFSAYGYAAEGGHLGPADGSGAQDTLDAKTQTLCTNIKADHDGNPDDEDIRLYTITFDVTDDSGIKTLMRDCASAPEYYYNSPTSSDLQGIFKDIALGLISLRVSE